MATNEATKPAPVLGKWCGRTLRSASPSALPEPLPICADCPAAWWYETRDRLECFCTKFRSTMFDKLNGPVTMCDAREEAIEEATA